MTIEELIDDLMKCDHKSEVLVDQEYKGLTEVKEVLIDKSRNRVVLRLDY